MGNTINIIILYVCLSTVLYVGQVDNGKGGYFGDDIISKWVAKDTNGNFLNSNSYSTDVGSASTKIGDPSTTKQSSGNIVFNIWDMGQVVWDFIKLIFNIIFVLPLSLLGLGILIPDPIKIGILIPLVIIGFSVFVFGIFGRR